MPQFFVDDDLAAAIWKLANPKPFEDLSFSTALRRVITLPRAADAKHKATDGVLEELATYVAPSRRAPTPSARQWAEKIQELKGVRNLSTWNSICDYLEIKTAGDSARRKLQKWVENNRPLWPKVPDTGI